LCPPFVSPYRLNMTDRPVQTKDLLEKIPNFPQQFRKVGDGVAFCPAGANFKNAFEGVKICARSCAVVGRHVLPGLPFELLFGLAGKEQFPEGTDPEGLYPQANH